MNERTLRKLDRLLERLDRDARRPRRRFPLAALYVVLGLVVGYQLLVRFVPMVWTAVLPHGLDSVGMLDGAPAMVWRLALLCRYRFEQVLLTACGVAIIAFVLARGRGPARFLAWLLAVAVVVLDMGIVLVTIKTCVDATLQGSAG